MNSILLSLVVVLAFLLLILVVAFFLYWIFVQKIELRRDKEWKEALHYGYQHFRGEELNDFLNILNDIYEGVERRKKMKK